MLWVYLSIHRNKCGTKKNKGVGNIKFLLGNARSLAKKKNKLEILMTDIGYNIADMTETWLDESHDWITNVGATLKGREVPLCKIQPKS